MAGVSFVPAEAIIPSTWDPHTKERSRTVPDRSPCSNAFIFWPLNWTPNLSSRSRSHSRLISKNEFVAHELQFNTHDPMSRSVAAISEGWTCNLSSPKNESGIRGSGEIFENRWDQMMEIGGSEPGRARRPDEILRTLTRSNGRVCGTWSWSASGGCGGDDS